jgi:TolA-binding protein
MLRRALLLAALLAVSFSGRAPARGDEDARTAPAFIQALREHGYYDLAGEYLERFRQQADVPDDFRGTIDYEQGRILLDEAAKTGDLVRRKELLEQARGKLEAFTKANPKHELVPEALVQLARLLVERGHLAVLMGEETEDKAEKNAKLVEARRSFDQARTSYAQAVERLQTEYKTFPPYIADDDPRKDRRERVHIAMMDAELQKAIVDYEQGQTYPLGTKQRTDLMARALEQFEGLYKSYRTQLAGLTARMWQAKCYEERGDLGPAMGIYNELMEHPDPRVKPLQRHVGYFQTIVLGKRKEYPLAVLGATNWLKAYSTNAEHRSPEGVGVRFERAKDLLAQLEGLEDEGQRAAYIKQATDDLGEVVRFGSGLSFKPEALELLKKYKPKAAEKLGDIARLSYEDALSQGEQAIASHDWDRAIPLLRQAVRRAEAAKDIDKTNYGRYHLAFCHYMNKQYYEALVLAEFLARRYPQGSLSAKATEIGIQSLVDAYNTYREIDRSNDLNHLIELANYTVATWPDSESGDNARMYLGQIYQGMGDYLKATAMFEAVRSSSSKWVDAQTRAGSAHWDQSRSLLRKGAPAAEVDAEVSKALGVLNAALKARRDSGAAPSDPGLMANACDIADIHLETGKPAEALALLDPIAKAVTPDPSPIYSRLLAASLRAHVASNQVDLAIADMNTLEQAGGSASRTQLYFSLGKLIEKEMDVFKKKGDSAGLNRMQQSYFKFLDALINSKAGQTYDSLEWAGENMLTLGKSKEAGGVFKTILEKLGKDPAFPASSGGRDNRLRTELKQAAAFRGQGDYSQAEALVDQLVKDYPRMIEVRTEKGLVLEARAAAKQGSWNAAFAQWQKLALDLAGIRPKPVEYYDAWYHAALALKNMNKTAEARQTLASVMRLSPTVGGPEMKAKYKEFLSQLK